MKNQNFASVKCCRMRHARVNDTVVTLFGAAPLSFAIEP